MLDSLGLLLGPQLPLELCERRSVAGQSFACEAEAGKKNELYAYAEKVVTDMTTLMQNEVGPPSLRPADSPLPAMPQPTSAAWAPSVARAPAVRTAEGGMGSENRLPERDVKKESMNATSRAQAAAMELCGKIQQKGERERILTAWRELDLQEQQRDVEDAAAPSDSGAAAT